MSSMHLVITNDDKSTVVIDATDVTVSTHPPVTPAHRTLLGSADPTGLPAGMAAHRIYYGMDNAPSNSSAQVDADAKAGMTSLLSVGPGANKQAVYNKTKMESFRLALEAPNVIGIPWHEPEDDKVTPSQYQDFVTGFAEQFPDTPLCPVLMASSYNNNNGDKWLLPIIDKFDYIGVDGYNRNDGRMPAAIFDSARNYANSHGKKLLICETGAVTEAVQLAYLDALTAYATRYPEVAVICYWNAKGPLGDYRLTPAGVEKFGQMLKSAPFMPIQ